MFIKTYNDLTKYGLKISIDINNNLIIEDTTIKNRNKNKILISEYNLYLDYEMIKIINRILKTDFYTYGTILINNNEEYICIKENTYIKKELKSYNDIIKENELYNLKHNKKVFGNNTVDIEYVKAYINRQDYYIENLIDSGEDFIITNEYYSNYLQKSQEDKKFILNKNDFSFIVKEIYNERLKKFQKEFIDSFKKR